MARGSRGPQLSTLAGLAASIVALASSPALRARLSALLGTQTSSGRWRLAAIILAVTNAKNFPFTWHIRLFRGLIYHVWFQPVPMPPSALFNFLIYRSHTPLWETDYNLHKSNSTYFTDVDISRTHLVAALLRNGIRGVGTRPGEEETTWAISTSRAQKQKKKQTTAGGISALGTSGADEPPLNTRNMTEEEFIEVARRPGPLLIALGSVACFFHREIPPYRSYEVWTRLLTWDRKWFYIVSYFVPPGTVRPASFSLQPWRNSGEPAPELSADEKQRLVGKVYATSIASYVVKKGRLTIPPEIVLQRSGMLPPRPSHIPSAVFTPSRTATPADGGTSGSAASGSSPSGSSASASAFLAAATSVLEESFFPHQTVGEWTWEKAEEQRLRGLHYAKAFDGLNQLRDDFDGGNGQVLGTFGDRYGIF